MRTSTCESRVESDLTRKVVVLAVSMMHEIVALLFPRETEQASGRSNSHASLMVRDQVRLVVLVASEAHAKTGELVLFEREAAHAM